jgi:hypothetical protein
MRRNCYGILTCFINASDVYQLYINDKSKTQPKRSILLGKKRHLRNPVTPNKEATHCSILPSLSDVADALVA